MKRDYFIYNGEDIVPEYLPGVPSYGQEGAEGNTGETGPSIHYSSYSIEDNLKTCIDLINNGKSLSNNIDEIEEPAYLEGDFIMDSVGVLWKIVYEKFLGKLSIKAASNLYSAGENAFRDFSASCVTAYNKHSTTTNINENFSYESDFSLLSSSPKHYHRYKYERYSYGNWILFKAELNEGYVATDFAYKFVLLLPNGEQLSILSDMPYATMFVDNNLFYSFSLDYDYDESDYLTGKYLNISAPNGVSKSVPAGNYTYKIRSNTSTITSTPQYVLSSTEPNDLKNMINYHGIDTYFENEGGISINRGNKEYDKFVAITISRYITDFCSAYVEAHHKESGKVYRLDLDDIYLITSTNELTGETDLTEHTSHIDIITPTYPHIEWAVHEYGAFLIDPNPLSDATKRFRRMDSFMIFPDHQDNSKSEDKGEQNFFYIDVTGIQKDYNGSHYYPNSYGEHDTPGQNIHDAPRTVRLKFMNADSLSITIEYNQFTSTNVADSEGTSVTMHPLTMIYIGVPDCDLISFGNNIQTSEDETFVEPGIYYLHRFVPISNTSNYGRGGENVFTSLGIENDNNTKIVNVGKAIFNIDLSEFKLAPNKMHFIEIGAVPIGSWIIRINQDDDGETCRSDISYWNSFHRETGSYSFENPYSYKSGISDVSLYVSEIIGLSPTSNLSQDENEYFAFTKGKLDTIRDEEGNVILETQIIQ